MSVGAAAPAVPAGRRVADRAAAARAQVQAVDVWPHTDRVLPWGVAIFIGMLMLVPFDAVSLPITLPLDAKLDRPILAAVSGFWLLSALAVRGRARPRMRLGPVHAMVALFFALCVGSVCLDATTLANLNELQLAEKKLVLLASFVLAFVLVTSIVRPEEVRNFTRLLLILAGVLSVFTIFEYRAETNVFYDWGATIFPGRIMMPSDLHIIDITGRTTVYGPMGHPLELALVLGMIVPLAMVPTLECTDRRRRWYWIALIGLLLAAIFSTQRKTGLLAVGGGSLLILAYRPSTVRSLLRILLALFVVLHILAPGAMGSLRQQLQPDRLTSSSSNVQRSDDYGATAPDVRRHTAIGRGFGSYDGLKYRILDNEYLMLMITVGALGTAAYILMYISGMLSAHRFARERGSPHGATMLGLSASLLTFLIGSVLFDVLSFSHITYLSFVILGLASVGASAGAPGRKPAAA